MTAVGQLLLEIMLKLQGALASRRRPSYFATDALDRNNQDAVPWTLRSGCAALSGA